MTFWDGAGRGLAVEFACDTVLQGEPVMVIGPSGSGVSTVLGEAAMRLVLESHVVRLDGHNTRSREDIFRSIRSVIGDDVADFVRDLDEHTLGMPLAIIIDNGDAMPPGAYAALVALRARLGSSLGILIGASAEMDWLTSSPGWEALQREYLVPLNPDEVGQFLTAVLGRTPDINTSALLWQVSGGWPGRLLARTRQQRLAGIRLADLPWRHLLAVAGLILLVLMLWLARSARETLEPLPLSLPEPGQRVQSEVQTPQSRDQDQTGVAVASQDAEKPPASVSKSEAPAPQPKPHTSGIVQTEITKLVESQTRTGTQSALASAYRREEWLLMAAADAWMLQLAITGHEDAARAMLTRVGLNRAAYYRSMRDGRAVFVVLSGAYPSREAAIMARDELPEAIRAASPFPRQLSTIQDEISGNAP